MVSGGRAGNVPAPEGDAAGPDADQADDGLHKGGLAAAVGADDGDDLALVHVDGHAVEYLGLPVAGHHAVGFKKRHRPGLPSRLP